MKIPSLAITGNICAGKSLCGSIFSNLGYAVLDADDIVKDDLQQGRYLYKTYTSILGEQILDDKRDINKAAVRNLIFKNKDLKSRIEDIVHPHILQKLSVKMKAIDVPEAKRICIVPLLFELRYEVKFSHIILVYCKDNIRLYRLMKIRRLDLETSRMLMYSQIDQAKKIYFSDFIIDNSYNAGFTEQQTKYTGEQINGLS